jgi:hypothetical protein
LFKNFFFANGIHLRMRMRKLREGNHDGQLPHILFGVPSSLKRSGARRRAVSSLVKIIKINAATPAAGDLLIDGRCCSSARAEQTNQFAKNATSIVTSKA